MVLTNAGKNLVRDFIGGVSATAPTHLAVGNDDTDASTDDTTMSSELTRKTFESSDTSAERKVTFEAILNSTEQNGQDLKELGLLNASVDGTLFMRVTHTAIEKSNSIDVQYIVELEIE